jgi:GNAT superfamily N-acetyltransferase
MAATETLRRADLTAADVPAALALSASVGWNQTAEDWRLFISHGLVLGRFAEGQSLVATAAALPYAAGFGWVSMVIVAPAWRGRGLARALVAECIETLQSRGCAALLDATPAGAEVYRALDFLPLARLERWEGEGTGTIAADRAVTTLTAAEIGNLVAADAAAFGAERRWLLDDFLRRADTLALAGADAFLMLRRGHRATQLGPFIAASEDTAKRLLAEAIARCQGPLFLDLFERWEGLVPLLEACGFRRQRPFLRMAQRRSLLPGKPDRLVCAAGPEFG